MMQPLSVAVCLFLVVINFESISAKKEFNLMASFRSRTAKASRCFQSPYVCAKKASTSSNSKCHFVLRKSCDELKTSRRRRATRDWYLTANELRAEPLPRSMSFYDRNADDIITLEEFASSLGHSPEEEHVQMAFSLADLNEDDEIDYQEFRSSYTLVLADDDKDDPDDDDSDDSENDENESDSDESHEAVDPETTTVTKPVTSTTTIITPTTNPTTTTVTLPGSSPTTTAITSTLPTSTTTAALTTQSTTQSSTVTALPSLATSKTSVETTTTPKNPQRNVTTQIPITSTTPPTGPHQNTLLSAVTTQNSKQWIKITTPK